MEPSCLPAAPSHQDRYPQPGSVLLPGWRNAQQVSPSCPFRKAFGGGGPGGRAKFPLGFRFRSFYKRDFSAFSRRIPLSPPPARLCGGRLRCTPGSRGRGARRRRAALSHGGAPGGGEPPALPGGPGAAGSGAGALRTPPPAPRGQGGAPPPPPLAFPAARAALLAPCYSLFNSAREHK